MKVVSVNEFRDKKIFAILVETDKSLNQMQKLTFIQRLEIWLEIVLGFFLFEKHSVVQCIIHSSMSCLCGPFAPEQREKNKRN